MKKLMNSNVVINDLVGFKNLKIIQNKEYFNFSLDSVLLPNFIHFNKSINMIMDICTGNAPIPLIMSTKTNSKIIGVEIQNEIYDLAKKTVELNHLENQIQLIHDDANNLIDYYESDTFDIITCNPPYFRVNEKSLRNDNEVKCNARHETLINLEQIIKIARKLLKNKGSLYIVHRTERLSEIMYLMKRNNIEPKRVRFVYPKQGTESNIVLIEGKKDGNLGLKVETPLIAHNEDGSYSAEVLKMFE